MTASHEKTSDVLWQVSVDELRSDNAARMEVFEQYKLYVEMADRVSARRNVATRTSSHCTDCSSRPVRFGINTLNVSIHP